MVAEGTYLVLSSAVLTLDVSHVSLERVPNEAAGPTFIWLTTDLTCWMPRAISVACALAASEGASPVSSTRPLYDTALMRAASPSFWLIWYSALNAMFWSSSCAPDVRRSVMTTAVVAAAPPTTSGAQADSDRAAVPSMAASSSGRATVLASGIIRCLLEVGRQYRRTWHAASGRGFPGCAWCGRWVHINGRRARSRVHLLPRRPCR